MLKVYMYGDSWRIQIGDEIWKFDTMESCQKVLSKMMEFKDEYGRLYGA